MTMKKAHSVLPREKNEFQKNICMFASTFALNTLMSKCLPEISRNCLAQINNISILKVILIPRNSTEQRHSSTK